MSIIRNLLYNSASSDTLSSSILYNQTLLHNFINQHAPKFIIHCGSAENALDLAHYARKHNSCEILYVKNWHPSSHQWLQADGNAPNPHQNFINKINTQDLQDYLISFDGIAQTAFEVLNYRNFRFDMMISDNLGDQTDYIPLMELLKKNALHIRYIGNKKLSELKNEDIFQIHKDISITYAQGYLITGMDYLSLYENNASQQINFPQSLTHDTHHNASLSHIEQHEDNILDNSNQIDNNQNISEPSSTNSEGSISPHEARQKRREERRLAREERRKKREARNKDLQNKNVDSTLSHETSDKEANTENVIENTSSLDGLDSNQENYTLDMTALDDDGKEIINTARQALRQKRAERRLRNKTS